MTWSVFGSVPMTVSGDGILLSPGGILEVVSSSQGRLKDYRVQPGDLVQQGQVVAIIDQPQIAQRLDEALRERDMLREIKGKTQDFQARQMTGRSRMNVNRRKDLEQSLTSSRDQMAWLVDRGKGLERLFEQNIIAKSKLLENMLEKGKVEQAIAKFENELRQLGMEEEFNRIQIEKELMDVENKISSVNIRIDGIEHELARETQIFSPYTGTVVELYSNAGEVVAHGNTLFSIVPQDAESQQDSGKLIAIAYVSPADGKKVKKGMQAQVIPAVVKRTEYGGMIGQVRTAADIPSSVEGMQHTLKNKTLITTLAGGASPYEVRVTLQPDPGNRTGYRWTSRAPNLMISPGTLCKVDILVVRVHPITLLIPALKPLLPDEVPIE
jgi:HlyD family secretion protein